MLYLIVFQRFSGRHSFFFLLEVYTLKRERMHKFKGLGGMDPLTAARLREQQSLGAVSWPSDTGEQYAVVFKGREGQRLCKGAWVCASPATYRYRTINQCLFSQSLCLLLSTAGFF